MTDEENTAALSREEVRRQVGERLLAARKKRQLSMEDAAGQLNIRITYLRALESGDWHEMPEDVYALGFLRQYARFLQADIDDLVRLLQNDELHLSRPFTVPDPAIAPKRQWAVAAAVLFVVLLIAFNISRQPSGSALLPTNPAHTGPLNEGKDLAPSPEPTQEAAVPPSPKAQASHETAQRDAPAPPAKAVEHQYIFKAVDDAVWLQVFDTGGALLREALLRSGERLNIRQAGDLHITCGNAAALEIRVDDTLLAAAGSLGSKGEVVRDLPVQPHPAANP